VKRFHALWLSTAAALACVAIPETDSILVTAGGSGGTTGGGSAGTPNNGGANNGATSGGPTDGGSDTSGGTGAQPTGGDGGTAAQATGGDGAGATTGGDDGLAGAGGSGPSYPVYAGFTLNLVEEFDAPIDLVSDPIWTYGDGGPSEGDVRYVKDAISFEGGLMKITVTEQPVASSQSYSQNDTVFAKGKASGELRTKFNNYRYGRYEVRVKVPYPGGATNGNFINEFATSRQPTSQEWRDIKIAPLGESGAALLTALYVADNQAVWGPQYDESVTTYPFGGAEPLPSGFNSRDDFHVYAFEWTPTQIRWFVDDHMVRLKDNGVGANSLAVPDESAKILLNAWVFNGNAFGGDPSSNVYPFVFEYDWFRFYKLDTDATYPCTPTPSCLPAGDLDLAKNNSEDGL